MKSNVLIVGAGQLGSRYLQGLARCQLPLSIHVSDVAPDSLARAKVRWQKVAADTHPHSLQLGIGLERIPEKIDLAIIATSANVRADVVTAVGKRCAVKHWVLEKVLAQSEDEIEQINSAIGAPGRAFVNTPRSLMAWYQAIKTVGQPLSQVTCEVRGGNWGLASNAVHFISLLAWWSGETLSRVDTRYLARNWHEANRQGFWEVYGALTATFSAGSQIRLICEPTTQPVVITLKGSDGEWTIQENEGIALRSDGLSIPGRIEFQSEMTAAVAASILGSGRCALPSLAESAALHRPFIRSLLNHWNANMLEKLARVPVT